MFQINWKLKALLYKILGLFPIKGLFYLIQKYITKRSKVEINKINKLWIYHTNTIEKNKAKSILEIGAGKSLEQNIYIAYKFNGLIEQTAIDINLMIDYDLVNQASKQISNILEVQNKGKVESLDQLKNLYNIDYRAPFSLKNLKENRDKFDICISTTALEHFKPNEIRTYLSDLKDLLTKKILVSSVIDYSDHYSHTDKNITALNFLSFSEDKWKIFNNSYLFQNRLRHQDYKKIFKEEGYKITEIFEGPVATAPLKICEQFDVKNEQTFIGWAYFLLELK
jgi:hypothetical protein